MHEVLKHGDPRLAHTTPTALIGVSGIGEAIAKHHLAGRQRWADDLIQVLRAGGEHQQQFGIRGHRLIAGRQQQLANALGQRRAARLPGQ
ncbi:hypothetical protein D3C77_670810 [compost metagenome]